MPLFCFAGRNNWELCALSYEMEIGHSGVTADASRISFFFEKLAPVRGKSNFTRV